MSDWRQVHANESEKALEHGLVTAAMSELLSNLKLTGQALPEYGVAKVASIAAQVARAQALGIDPDYLRMNADEARSEQLRLAAEAALQGVPVHIIEGKADVHTDDRPSG